MRLFRRRRRHWRKYNHVVFDYAAKESVVTCKHCDAPGYRAPFSSPNDREPVDILGHYCTKRMTAAERAAEPVFEDGVWTLRVEG